jgi:cytochrome b561
LFSFESKQMSSKISRRYGAISQSFHWLTAIVVLVAFVYGPGGSEERVYLPQSGADRQVHETLGICVFVLAVLRLLWRTVATRPDPPQVPRWMGLAATATQYGLYILMLALPVTAIFGAWFEGHPLTLLFGTRIYPPMSSAHAIGSTLAEVHGWLGDVIMWLAGLHAVAALYHHIVAKDGVLISMLPGWIPPRGGDSNHT